MECHTENKKNRHIWNLDIYRQSVKEEMDFPVNKGRVTGCPQEKN